MSRSFHERKGPEGDTLSSVGRGRARSFRISSSISGFRSIRSSTCYESDALDIVVTVLRKKDGGRSFRDILRSSARKEPAQSEGCDGGDGSGVACTRRCVHNANLEGHLFFWSRVFGHFETKWSCTPSRRCSMSGTTTTFASIDGYSYPWRVKFAHRRDAADSRRNIRVDGGRTCYSKFRSWTIQHAGSSERCSSIGNIGLTF